MTFHQAGAGPRLTHDSGPTMIVRHPNTISLSGAMPSVLPFPPHPEEPLPYLSDCASAWTTLIIICVIFDVACMLKFSAISSWVCPLALLPATPEEIAAFYLRGRRLLYGRHGVG